MMMLLCCLFACDLDLFGTSGTPQNPANTTQKNKKQKKSSKEKVITDLNRPYEASGKRDPFRSFLSSTTIEDVDESMLKDPKTRYDVREYILTGVIWNIDQPLALVEDPTGEGHVVEIGEYLGKKYGKVREITDNKIIVVEEVRTTDGEKVPKPILRTLRQDGVVP